MKALNLFLLVSLLFSTANSIAQCPDPPILQTTEDFDHHCQGDSLSVEVLNPFEVSCGDDAGIYSFCHGNFVDTIFTYCPDNLGDGTAMTIDFLSGTMEEGFDYIQVYDGPDATGELLAQLEGDVSDLSFVAANADGCISLRFFSDFSISCETGQEEEVFWEVGCALNANYYTVQWEPAVILSDPNAYSTEIIFIGSDQEFTVTVFETDNPECSTTETINVTYFSDYQFGENTTTGLCSTEEELSLTSLLNGNADEVGTWFEDGQEISGTIDPANFESGLYTYSYEFCEDRSVELDLTVVDPPVLETEDTEIYCAAEQISVSIDGYDGVCSDDVGSYSYCYDNFEYTLLTYCPNNPDFSSVGINFNSGFMEATYDFITVFDGPDDQSPVIETFDGDVSGRSYTANNPSGCLTILIETDFSVNCVGGNVEQLQWDVVCTESVPDYDIVWSNPLFLENPNEQVTEVNDLVGPTTFEVVVNPSVAPGCTSTASLLVTPIDDIDLGEDTVLDICIDAEPIDLLSALSGNPENVGNWVDAEGNPVSTFFNPQEDESDVFYYTYPECTANSELVINVRPLPNVSAGSDEIICLGQEFTLSQSGASEYDWEGLGAPPVTVSPTETTTYTVTGTNAFGCSATDQVTITVEEVGDATITENDGVLSVSFGNTFQWYLVNSPEDLPILGANSSSFTPLSPGTYYVIINPNQECVIQSDPYVVTNLYEKGELSLKCYPQPFEDSFIIESSEIISSLRIFSLNGQRVYDQQINEQIVQLHPSLESGVYLLELTYSSGEVHRRKIIQK
jgi:hypothetical protein